MLFSLSADGKLKLTVAGIGVKNTPGFEKFQSSHNQRLTNLDRTVYWRFAARFSAKYYKVPWPAGISLSGGNTVRKAAIETVLGMKSTALTQAENSSRVLAIYYDGTHKSEEVVKRVEETTEGKADTGSGVLYKFLVQWEKDHPVND
ncbi:hypothetical protein B0H16DRAFT_1474715 [Mycena metata]|uniref:Uncharacterized protein n=1 Tax=Mycena metata TaxID=1033252 RepID=A0AAD7HGT4_9AGAR|nr:hypothetical protein B0H16DRAFT_1474715 [Mycena metata]